MNTDQSPETLQITSQLASGRLYALIAPGARAAMLEIAAQMAAGLPETARLRVIDAGNWFNAYAVASRLRQLLDRSEAASVLPYMARIQVARAFTCFQAAQLLQEAAAQPADWSGPCLVLDFLGTFQDENVPYRERLRLLRASLPDLRRLCSRGPVLVSARPGDPAFTGLLIEAADAFVQLPDPAEHPAGRQISFWEG